MLKEQQKFYGILINQLKFNQLVLSQNIMDDKEWIEHMNGKIKETLEWIDSQLSAKGGDDEIENWDGQTPRELLIQVKLILERKE